MSVCPPQRKLWIDLPYPVYETGPRPLTISGRPVWAREVFGIVIARSRMLPFVRPLMRQRTAAGLYGISWASPNHHQRARSTVKSPGSSDPVSPTVAPYSPSDRSTPLPSRRAYIAGTGARYSPPVTSKAQTIRAVLFANATVTSIFGLRGNI